MCLKMLLEMRNKQPSVAGWEHKFLWDSTHLVDENYKKPEKINIKLKFCTEVEESVIYNRKKNPIDRTLATPPFGQKPVTVPSSYSAKIKSFRNAIIFYTIRTKILYWSLFKKEPYTEN